VEFTSLIGEFEGETFRGHDGVRRRWKEVVLPLAPYTASLRRFASSVTPFSPGVLGTYRPRGVEEIRRFGT
jgi:hypothetical protein